MGLCRYDDVIHLRWRNIKFDAGYQCFHIDFEKRKNDQYRQGNRVTVAAAPDGLVCPLKLMRMMMLWGQHGDWKSVKSQNIYMKRDPEAILSVSWAAKIHVIVMPQITSDAV